MTFSTPRIRRAGLALALAGSLAAAGCSSGQSTETTQAGSTPKSGPITLAYLQKQGDQQYFVDQAEGARRAASELGDVTVNVVNLGTDANKAISELEAVIARGVDGIAIVVPDQQIGPQVIQRAKEANIPLVASDDAIKAADGSAAPFVGFNGTQMGEKVGAKAAELYKAAGWTAADTRIISAYKQDLSVCQDRVNGAASAFDAAVEGDLPQTIEVGTDNSATDAQNKTGATLTANQGVDHWIVWGCNDENETGVVTALQNGDVNASDIIGVGLGAYLTCKDWKAGQNTGNKAALFIDGAEVGASAVRALVDKVRNGKDLPAETVANTTIVDAANYEQAGVKCT